MLPSACTIVSLNYLHYARALCRSFLRHHPDGKFYVLLVDRLPKDFDLSSEEFYLVLVDELGVPNFDSVAFKYDIMELNTNVKPTLLKVLFSQGVEQIVYLDPDIFIYRPLDSVFGALADHAIALTPHILSPDQDLAEQVLLSSGVFNLGFVAVKKCPEAVRFLDWWEARCLGLAYDEQRTGLFVDQKWVNFVPCLFDSVCVLRTPGCNMAYWNLHERQLSLERGMLLVNREIPLEFYHFSGISVEGGERISKYTDRFTLTTRPDLRGIFEEYRAELVKNGSREAHTAADYVFGSFDNGQYINRLTRSLYAANLANYLGENPFSSSSKFYQWAKSAGIFGDRDTANTYTQRSYSKREPRLRMIHALLRGALRVLGADRYTVLLRYLSYISILRNQIDVFPN